MCKCQYSGSWRTDAVRLKRTLGEEVIDLRNYDVYQDAYGQFGLFLYDGWMHKQVHPRLLYRTPAELDSH